MCELYILGPLLEFFSIAGKTMKDRINTDSLPVGYAKVKTAILWEKRIVLNTASAQIIIRLTWSSAWSICIETTVI